jgi:hypothetical protein
MPSSRPINPEALGADLADHLNLFIDAAQQRPTFAARGNIFEELSRHYRALGICVAVAEGDSDGFFHWLIQSALARRYYLQGIGGEGGGEARYRRTSFVDPVLDAVAARQWDLGREITELSSDTWLPGEEYEDDFLYGLFVKKVLAGTEAELPAVLQDWDRALEGGQDLRRDMSAAYAARDASAFCLALRVLLDATEVKAKLVANRKTDSTLADDFPFHPNRWVSVEGLAWLALAQRVGLSTPGEFPACPGSLVAGTYAPFKPLAYPPIELR